MMKITLTQTNLASLLFCKGCATMQLPDGTVGVFQSALRESGCGTSFILTFNVPYEKVYKFDDGYKAHTLSRSVQVLCKIK